MNEKVLFVDDDPNLLAACERNFRRQFTLETAAGGEAALQRIADHGPFAVVIADRQMPLMDGFQVLEALNRIETSGYVPVLVITAQPAHKLRALQAGAKDFVSKPFDMLEVQTRIHNSWKCDCCIKNWTTTTRHWKPQCWSAPLN